MKEDNYFMLKNDTSSYWTFSPPKDQNDKIYGQYNKLRSMLKLPNLKQYEHVSLRTAFARLSIKLYQKLGQYSDTSDYIIDSSELPQNEQNENEINDVEMSDSQSSFSNININDIL